MKEIESLSEKRLIVEAKVFGGEKGEKQKSAYFLLDSGAVVGMMDSRQKKAYSLVEGRRYPNDLIGAGGKVTAAYMCNSPVEVGGRKLAGFVLSDLSQIRESIRRNTEGEMGGGIDILGIISLSQMKSIGMMIDLTENTIHLK